MTEDEIHETRARIVAQVYAEWEAEQYAKFRSHEGPKRENRYPGAQADHEALAFSTIEEEFDLGNRTVLAFKAAGVLLDWDVLPRDEDAEN